MPDQNNIFVKFAHKIGMDGAIAYSSAARVFQAFAGVLSIFFIASFLTGEEQGFYFTFGSILAIQVFFELGFTGIMTQYVAHEAAYLRINSDYSITGEQKNHSRLAYLLRFCIKWYSIVASLFFVVVTIAGYVYFNRYDDTGGKVSWQIPWLILSVTTSIKMFQSPITSIFQGLGYVKEMNKVGFYQQVLMPVSIWIGLACSLKLYVVGVSSTIGVLIWFFYVYRSGLWRILIGLWRVDITERVGYMKEIFPYQWKIALSWISGYFIFQLFNPVLFATEGAVIAGQMGMTLQIVNAVQAFAMSWQNTKVPLYSRLIELKQYNELDTIFNKTLRQMSSISFVLLLGMFVVVYCLRVFHIGFHGNMLADRFLSYIPMLMLSITVIVNQFVASWATYLRCHKQEPFLINSVVMGCLCCLSTFVLGNIFGLYGVLIGYTCLVVLVSGPWSYHIYITKKKEWHNGE